MVRTVELKQAEIISRFEHIGGSRRTKHKATKTKFVKCWCMKHINLDVEGTGEAVLHKFVSQKQVLEVSN